MIPNNQQEWSHHVALTSAQNLVVEVAAPGSGITVVDSSQYNKLTWSIRTELTAEFQVEGSFEQAFGAGNFDIIYGPISILAATLSTPYNLASPLNSLGYVVINQPFIRLRLTETATSAHTFTHFYAKAWE